MRKCKVTIKSTGLKCGKDATCPIYSIPYKKYNFNTMGWENVPASIIGYECPKHAKEFDLLRISADAVAYRKASGNN